MLWALCEERQGQRDDPKRGCARNGHRRASHRVDCGQDRQGAQEEKEEGAGQEKEHGEEEARGQKETS